MTMPDTGPAIRYHGSKWRLFPWLNQHFPEHRIYVEPFGGSASVLLQKPRSHSEVYNDLDGDIVNYFQVLRDPESRLRLIESIQLTPYSRQEYEYAYNHTDDPVERARRFAVRGTMGYCSGAASGQSSGFRSDSSRKYVTAAALWARFPYQLQAVGERLSGVLVEHSPAIEVMHKHDHEDAFMYLDPPYLFDTRKMRGRVYKNEMTNEQHLQLCDVALQLKAKVMISGYANSVYDNSLSGWIKRSTLSRIAAGRGTKLKTETIWMNHRCAESVAQIDLFQLL